jgi:N4-gp56 family major capsid protein
MTIQKYASPAAGRVHRLKGEILANAIPVEVLGITGMNKKMPKNQGDNVVFRRWLPFGNVDNRWITPSTTNAANNYANAHVTVEGVTPTADTLTPTDIPAVLEQYSALYAVTDKTVDLHEDDIPSEMKRQVGQRIGLVREMVRYGVLQGAGTVLYAGGSDRGTVDEAIDLPLLRRMTRTLRANHAGMITSILAPSPNYETRAVEAGYLVFCHTDVEADIREMKGFVKVAEYGSRKPIHEMEIGTVENFRFILSPELAPILGAGANKASLKLQSTDIGGTQKIDVYPCIVAAEDAWGQVALRGVDSLDVTYLPPGSKDKNDPLGQRGYIGAKTWFTAKILNDGWMGVIECGVDDLSA